MGIMEFKKVVFISLIIMAVSAVVFLFHFDIITPFFILKQLKMKTKSLFLEMRFL